MTCLVYHLLPRIFEGLMNVLSVARLKSFETL